MDSFVALQQPPQTHLSSLKTTGIGLMFTLTSFSNHVNIAVMSPDQQYRFIKERSAIKAPCLQQNSVHFLQERFIFPIICHQLLRQVLFLTQLKVKNNTEITGRREIFEHGQRKYLKTEVKV